RFHPRPDSRAVRLFHGPEGEEAMSDTIPARPGSCIRLECVFRDEKGEAEDLTADTFEIRDASPASLAADFAITPVDPLTGRIELLLAADGAKKLRPGRVNRFRLCRLKAGGCEDNSNLLWI